ncbi:MAG: glycerophosphodiester phosphodiesterase family protein [Nocardioides sp.]
MVSAPLVLAHRGASGYRPEHTVAAYELSVAMGADYFEPDLVMTRDGVLVDRHEPEIGSTTDVARRPEFADRRTTKLLDGTKVTGWWVEDFTIEEFKTLRAIERLPAVRPANTTYDGHYEVPTFTELLELRERWSEQYGRVIGIIPEIKHSTYLRGLGFDPEAATVRAIEHAGLNRAEAPLWIQSFEVSTLLALRTRYGYRAKQLLLAEDGSAPYDLVAAGDPRSYADLCTAEGLGELAARIDGIGPEKVMVIPRRSDNTLAEPTNLVADAHRAGLLVLPWTFRAENHFLPNDMRVRDAHGVLSSSALGRADEEALAYFDAGIDGMFCDNTDVYVEARRRFLGC